TNMVDQILDLTRSRLGGGIPLNPKPMALNDAVARAVDELRLIHPTREIHCTMAPDVRGEWDGQRLMQVVSNLVGNAITHGTGTVYVAVVGDDDCVRLEVANGGEPIAPEVMPMIFQPFTRAGDRKGLGLGLFIASEIVRAHEGRIDVTSSREKGTTFTVRWPKLPAR
ncbi:MAG TPA: HAMP domain-containing sensor histidine kinase, partial [Polyangia bacterium]